MKKHYDVIVIGAGPAGSSSAYFLAQKGLKVLLLDKAEFPRDKTCGDGLTPRALWTLSEMGILDQVYQIGHRVNRIAIHGRRGKVLTSELPKNTKYHDHLLIAPRLKLDNIIRERALFRNVEFKSPVWVRDITEKNDKLNVHASYNGKKIDFKTRLVVLAVGANMKLLKQLNILKYQPEPILAARGYFEGVSGLTDQVEAHFEDVPLPGYGWIFPTSNTSANIGIGYWKSRLPWKKPATSAKLAMDSWLLNSIKIKKMLINAKPIGPIRGYPLRVDFATAPTYQGRIFLVGEAAGLVSPLSGEGIDFALESGRLLSEYVTSIFEKDDFSEESLAGYDVMLRENFQNLFLFLTQIRQIYVNPYLMDRYIQACRKFPELKELVIKVMIGQIDAAEMMNISTIRKVVFRY